MLGLEGVTKYFGGLAALSGVSLRMAEGEITAVIGPNGAGKTTLFSLIAGTLTPTSGRILFQGRDVTCMRPDQVCRLGIGRTFQIVRPFPGMTVQDHLRAASLFGGQPKGATAEIDDLLELTQLRNRAHLPARALTLAGCKRLEIARALATGAKLLLLDETMAGLTPEETREAIELVKKVRDSGRTVLLIEHVLAAVTNLCDRAIVLEHGEVIADGNPHEVLASEVVRKAYLGD